MKKKIILKKFLYLTKIVFLCMGCLNEKKEVLSENPDQSRTFWDDFYRTNQYVTGVNPSSFLVFASKFIEKDSIGLIIPMEEGRNAVYAALKGAKVSGIDISQEALIKSQRLARENNVRIKPINADLNTVDLEENLYDWIFVTDIHRTRFHKMFKNSIKHGGYLFYEHPITTEDRKKEALKEAQVPPLAFKEWFSDWTILQYKEEKRENGVLWVEMIAQNKKKAESKEKNP